MSQLDKIDLFIQKRKKIYKLYEKEFTNFNSNLIIPNYISREISSYHLFVVNIAFEKLGKNKDNFFKYLISKKIIAQQHYIPIYKFSIYDNKYENFLDTEKFIKNSLSIPIFVDLNLLAQKKIIKTIKNFFSDHLS